MQRLKKRYPTFTDKEIIKLLSIQANILKINYENFTIITNKPTLNKLHNKIKNLIKNKS